MLIRVAIADDHNLIREGIQHLLELEDDIRVVAHAANGEECIEMLESTPIDVLLLDINMPKKNGLEVIKIIKEKSLSVKVLVLTIHNEAEYLIKAVEMGINGYVLKDSGSDILKKAIYSIYNGEEYIQSDLIPILNSGLIILDKDREKINRLSKREIEVLVLIARGMFNKEIATQLTISERTVKNHISNIFRKIDVADRTQAAVFAIKNGLVDIYIS